MSSIDERIVNMKFNNGQFENGVKSSISSIDKLKKAMNLDGAKKSLAGLSSEGKKFSLEGLSHGIEGLASKFSALSVVGITALASIANKAVQVGASMIKSLSLDPILAGFAEYEVKLGSIQTILANTSASGTTLDDVSASLGKLNDYADKTIYNFGDMTRNIGLFTNAGIGLEDATSMIQGFSNAAAASGTTSEGAAGAAYQLSQALSTGTIRLMDWRSLTNVGMGNKNMQNSIIDIAAAMGELDKAGISATDVQADFNGSLEKNWLSADVMSTYLKIMAGEMDKASIEALGLSDAQTDALLKQAATAEEAATKVRTWTQLIGTMRESVGSSWSETAELVIGDFDEATKLFTYMNDKLGGLLGKAGEARNKVLGDWKELGGRTQLVKAFKQGLAAILEIAAPIQEAFREIFPATTGKQLFDLTVGIKNFLKELRPSEKTVANLKSTFKGLFAIFDIGWMVIKGIIDVFKTLFGTIDGAGGGLLEMTGNFGDWIVSVRDALKEGKGIEKFFKTFGDILATPITMIKALIGWFKDLFSGDFATTGIDGALDGLQERLKPLGALGESIAKMWPTVTEKFNEFKAAVAPAMAAVKEFFGTLWDALKNAMSTGDFSGVLDMVNTGLLGGIVLLVKRFLDNGIDLGGASGFLTSIKDAFGGLTGVLTTMQNNLKADTLFKLAASIGLITLSVVALSMIDSDKLATALVGITVMMGTLMGAMTIMDKITASAGFAKMPVLAAALLIFAGAMVIMAGAVKIMSGLSWEELAKGLGGVAVAMALMLGAVNIMSGKAGMMFKTAAGLVVMALALKIMASAIGDFAEFDWDELGKGFAGVATALAMMAGFSKLSKGAGGMVGSAVGLLIMAVALKAISSAVRDFADMDWETMGRGMAGMAGALLIIAGAMNLMPANMLLTSVGLVLVAGAITVLSDALKDMGGMSWEEIGKSMVVLAGSLAILAGAMALMGIPLVLLGAVGLIAAAGALSMLAPALVLLSTISWAEIGSGLGILAAALGIMAVMGILLIPASVGFLALGAALLLIGTGVALAGVGVSMLAVGLVALAAAGAAGAFAITTLGKAVIELIPELMTALGEGLVNMVEVIANNGKTFIEAGETLIGSLLTAINNKGPEIIDTLFNLIMALVDELEENVPKFVDSGLKMINGILEGISDNIGPIAEQGTAICTEFLEAISKNVPTIVDAGMQMVVDTINGIADAIEENSPQVDAAIVNLVEVMKTALINSIGTFTGIGGDIVAGIASGISGGVSSVISAASNIATSAINAAKSALGIASPSKEFQKLGKYSVQGFVKGLNGDKDSVREAYSNMNTYLKEAMANAKDDIDKHTKKLKELRAARDQDTAAIRRTEKALIQARAEYAKSSAARVTLIKNLDDEKARLVALAGKIDVVNEKLTKARQKLADAQNERSSYSASIKQQFSDLTDITADTKLTEYMDGLKEQVEKTNEFRIKMKKLDLLGLNDTMYKELMSQGVEAIPFIDQLLKSGKSGVRDMNVLSKDLAGASSKLGSSAAHELYDAGVNSALGLVEGLKKHKKKIEKQMDSIADYMVRAIRKKLGIKSPSQEFAEVGKYSMEGLAQGLVKNIKVVESAAETVGDSAITGLQKSLSNMSYAVDSSLDMQPVIQPVLDLTDIRKNAGQISGILAPDSIVPTSSYGKAATIATENRAIQQSMATDTFATEQERAAVFSYTQNNYSPKPLPASEIYRNTKNQISTVKGGLKG